MAKDFPRKLTRREFVLSLTAIGTFTGIGYAKLFEPEHLELTSKTVQLGLTRPIRLLHLSDFHLSPVVSLSYLKHAAVMSANTEPDIICLTGDYVTTKYAPSMRKDYSEVFKLFAKTAPTYATFGNHDGGSWVKKKGGFESISEMRALLEESNVLCLYNSSTTAKINGSNFTLVGVGDEWADEVDVEKAFQAVDPASTTSTIVLCHNPDSKDRFRSYSWQLMLCGHTHGGQFVIPFTKQTPFAPVMDHNFVSGLNSWEGHLIHTTRGLGNVHGVRFNCRPEISLLELV